MSNEITAYFKGRIGVAESVYQYDYGMVIVIDGMDFTNNFDCYFSTSGDDEAIPAIGSDNRVAIPNSCLTRAGDVTLHIPTHTGENDSEVENVVTFRVIGRARPVDDGTEEEQSAVSRAIALLNHTTSDVIERIDAYLDENASEPIQDWLDDHPEATTTVQDDSLTTVKYKDGSVTETKLSNELKMKTIKDYVTPQMFGAVGDGLTDDTNAFRSMFSCGKPILIPESEYLITGTVDVASETIVVSLGGAIKDGRAETALSDYSGLFHGVNVSDVIFNGLIINGTGALEQGSSVLKCDFYFKDSQNIRIENTRINDTSSGHAILFNHCDMTTVANSVIDNFSYCGIANLNEGSNFSALYNSIINGTDSSHSGNNYSIILNGYDDTLSEATYGGKNLRAIGNYCRNENPIWEYIDAHGGSDIIVVDNVLDNATSGISCFNEPAGRLFDIQNMIIANNVITCSNMAGSNGITCGGHNVVVENNIIKNASTGIRGRFLYESSIQSNQISESADDALLINELVDVVVKDNLIVGNATAYGIRVTNILCDNVLVEDNTLRNLAVGYRTPTAHAEDNYLIFKNNEFHHVTQIQSVSADPGVIPQFFTSAPNFATTAKKFDVVYNSNWDGTNAKGWMFSGDGWIEL